MKTIDKKTLDQMLAPGDDKPVTPEHRAWMNEQIEKALERKRSGKATFKSLDDVRRKYGL